MKTDILAVADALSDQDLLGRLDAIALHERLAVVDLVAHLAALDARPSLYAARGYGSLFSYCTEALRLSEDAACNRIEAARTCRKFPAILETLASGALSLTSVRLLGRHLTSENYEAVLARAAHRRRREIEVLVAELAPSPDIPSSVRMLPRPKSVPGESARPAAELGLTPAETAPAAANPPVRRESRPVLQASAPERYRVQFTVGREGHETLRRLQNLLRKEIPDGDPGVICERALALLLDQVERQKRAATVKPRRRPSIRPGTDKSAATLQGQSRHIPNEVARAVWRRDGDRCAFVSDHGQRCTERSFLELHHIHPFAHRGPATVDNISVRCRRHNQYEAELVFGARRPIDRRIAPAPGSPA